MPREVAANLSNFPVLVSRSSDADLAADAQADGDDLLFTAGDGTTKLAHEIESYSSGTGGLVAWVRVASLSSSSNTVLYPYYGNAGAASQQNATGVWDSNYVMVQHLEETSGNDNDSTSYANNGTTVVVLNQNAGIIEMLRQRSRPYLFSNTVAPCIVGASIAVLDMLTETTELRDKLEYNTKYFRTKMTEAGFDIKPGDHPTVPIMLYDSVVAQQFAAKLLDEGVYVIGFFYPVVAKGLARIRVQLSAAHEQAHLDKAIAAFTKVGKELSVLK